MVKDIELKDKLMSLHHYLYELLIEPTSVDEDRSRKEFILNIFLCASSVLFIAAFTINLIDTLLGAENSVSAGSLFLLSAFVVLLLLLSRLGRIIFASQALVITIFILAACLAFSWGVDLPSSLLLFTLAVVMSGVLISTRYAFMLALGIVVYMALLTVLESLEIVSFDKYWRQEHWSSTDSIVAGIIFLIIATVSWLGNREIGKSLARARHSEAALIEERDHLELRVQERTAELQAAELERMSQAYRFVEFGRLSGSIFHDLSGPLTALSLNLECIAKEAGDRSRISLLAQDIERARNATSHMQRMMEAMRRHLAHEGSEEEFSITSTIAEVVPTLSSYAHRYGITLNYQPNVEVRGYGDSVAFIQIITNIVCNAVESFSGFRMNALPREPLVIIQLDKVGEEVIIKISDNGSGMDADTQSRIFEPFFTTKSSRGGMGIGLPLAQRILQRSFNGCLLVSSVPGNGTEFTLFFPKACIPNTEKY